MRDWWFGKSDCRNLAYEAWDWLGTNNTDKWVFKRRSRHKKSTNSHKYIYLRKIQDRLIWPKRAKKNAGKLHTHTHPMYSSLADTVWPKHNNTEWKASIITFPSTFFKLEFISIIKWVCFCTSSFFVQHKKGDDDSAHFFLSIQIFLRQHNGTRDFRFKRSEKNDLYNFKLLFQRFDLLTIVYYWKWI